MVRRLVELRVVGIAGSLREHSCSHLALAHAITLLRQLGCSTQIIDLRKTQLPFCNGDKNETWSAYPGVAELRTGVSRAHALLLVTPEYHGGVSGVLKNALDLLEPKDLDGKVTGTISVLGGPANSSALNDLSRIMRWCHAWVIPQHIAIGRASQAFVDGQVADKDLRQRFEEFAESLMCSTVRICGLDGFVNESSRTLASRVNIHAAHAVDSR